MTVRSSRHGPIISDIIPNAATGAGFAIALADPNLRTDDESAEAFMKLNRAGSWTEFQDSLRQFHAPHQNFVYADVAGNIGFIAAARVPIRKKGLASFPRRAGPASTAGAASSRSRTYPELITRNPARSWPPTTGSYRPITPISSHVTGRRRFGHNGSAICWRAKAGCPLPIASPCSATPCPCRPDGWHLS